MKKSFSLIELIFTIVIIALVFSTIPRIMYTTNETFKFNIKEAGIFNMMTKVMDISFREWDENDTNSYDILLTKNTNVLECDANNKPEIRIGGFYSGDSYSRMCQKHLDISHIGVDSGENSEEDYDDVDDFNNTEDNATKQGNTRYKIYVINGYSDEWDKNNYDYDNKSLSFTFSNDTTKDKSNIKLTRVTLYDNKYDKNISNARYWHANIGKIAYIESEQW